MKVESNANAMVVSGSYQIDWKGTVSSQLKVAERGVIECVGGKVNMLMCDRLSALYSVYSKCHHRVHRVAPGYCNKT